MPDNIPHSPGFVIARDPTGKLIMTDQAGRQHVGVVVVRAFPISDPHYAVSICDSRGHEIAYVASLETLPPETRQLLETELARREFMPTIQRILNDPPHTEPTQWQVLTDRGTITFRLERDSDVRRYGEHTVLVIDSNGMHYQIPDLRQLDVHSRRVLDRVL
ncbi:MAG TPA: DUF1854 domain-containing protein [Pirellulaceae bacterium]|jgi:hypothetical protein